MTASAAVLAGRYRLDRRIAAGGVGEVWRAVDLVLDRPVAVKLLRSQYAGQALALARFRAEARHAGAVSHPGVARVYDYGEAGIAESPYLVMELVDGPSLAEVLAPGPLDVASSLDVLAQAAAGLQAAHEVGLVHRDVKPGNLLIGQDGQVKITDFGIAHAAGSVPITLTGTVIGTPAYLAPERVVGGPASPASDLYSLGMVGYECLTGTVPFSGTALEVAAAHQQCPLPPLPASVPPAVARLVSDLTAKDPAMRPASAGEAAETAARLLERLTAGTPTLLTEVGNRPLRPAPADPDDGGTLTDRRQATLVDPWLARVATSGRGSSAPHRNIRERAVRPWRRRLGLAVVGAAAAGLTGWLVAGALATPAASHPAPVASRPATSPTASPTVQTVDVNSAALVGQSVFAVRQSLLQLGLMPVVQGAGTVLSVQPSGTVPVGSTVTVTAASPFSHHGHHGFGGNGGNRGNGDGGEDGG